MNMVNEAISVEYLVSTPSWHRNYITIKQFGDIIFVGDLNAQRSFLKDALSSRMFSEPFIFHFFASEQIKFMKKTSACDKAFQINACSFCCIFFRIFCFIILCWLLFSMCGLAHSVKIGDH